MSYFTKFFSQVIDKKYYQAIMWMSLACIGFTIFSLLHSLVEDVIPPFQAFFMSSCVSLVFWLVFFSMLPAEKRKTKTWWMFILRGLLIAGGMSLWFYVLTIMPTVDAVAISYCLPIMNSFFGMAILREPVRPNRLISLFCGFIGMVLIIKPSAHIPVTSILLCLSVPLMWSISDIYLKMQTKTENPTAQCFYLMIFTCIFAYPKAYFEWVPFEFGTIIPIMAIGIVFAINVFFVFKAYSFGDMGYVSGFDFSRLILIAILSYYLFGEVLSLTSYMGCILIFLSSLSLTYFERKYELAKEISA